MKYWPSEELTIVSSLSAEDIRNRVKELIGYGYRGKIAEQSFEMKREISYRNSFLPVIKGTIHSDLTGTEIRITMQLPVFVKIFMLIWCGFSGLIGLVMIPVLFSGKLWGLQPWGMLAFAYLLTLMAFKWESRRSIRDLRELFESEPRNTYF